MSDRVHDTYDEIAGELGKAARRMMAPALMAVRKTREGIEADNARARAHLGKRPPSTIARTPGQQGMDRKIRERLAVDRAVER